MKKFLFTLLAVVVILILANPSLQRFKDFNDKTVTSREEKLHFRRSANFLIFSVYERSFQKRGPYVNQMQIDKDVYIGILTNFFQVDYSTVVRGR